MMDFTTEQLAMIIAICDKDNGWESCLACPLYELACCGEYQHNEIKEEFYRRIDSIADERLKKRGAK